MSRVDTPTDRKMDKRFCEAHRGEFSSSGCLVCGLMRQGQDLAEAEERGRREAAKELAQCADLRQQLVDQFGQIKDLRAALVDAAKMFESATQYNHREWHLEHEDVEPKDCPDCQGRQLLLDKWAALTA